MSFIASFKSCVCLNVKEPNLQILQNNLCFIKRFPEL